MTAKRFTVDEDGYFDKINHRYVTIDYLMDLVNMLDEENTMLKERRHEDINELSVIAMKYKALEKENEQLKKELLFFYDVANCECSTNWKEDMEKGCKRFFNCTYEEAKEKYGDYNGMWWEIND